MSHLTMSLAALNLQNASTTPPSDSDRSESPQEPAAELETREWLKLSDVCLTFLQGTPQRASWTAGLLVILSVPDSTGTASRSKWYFMFVPQSPSVEQGHTIDLSTRPWRVYVEEGTFTFAFEIGDVAEGDALRYFVKTSTKRSFDYLLSYISYVKACCISFVADSPRL